MLQDTTLQNEMAERGIVYSAKEMVERQRASVRLKLNSSVCNVASHCVKTRVSFATIQCEHAMYFNAF